MIKKVCWSIIFCSVFVPGYLFAHPHVFIDNTVTIVFDRNGLSGIRAKWVFDEMFSSMIIHDYDRDKDGTFSAAEIEKIRNGAFSNIKKFHYFTHVKIEGKDFIVKYVKDFSASLDNESVVYAFFIPCHVAATPSYKEIKIFIYDDTYYVDIALAEEDPVRFENAVSADYDYRIIDDTENPYYYGQVFPQGISVRFKKK
ncbi:MAG: DUF1007 family protein [Proteobacteria bacterium]|nr:DUF1007 family protein [Pseudomonadota bacterium]